MIFSIVLGLVGAAARLPADPSWSQRVWNGVIGATVAGVAFVTGTYLLALLCAPFQQRNALRRMVTDLQAEAEFPNLNVLIEGATHHNRPSILLTNKGPTDEFSAFVQRPGDPASRKRLAWDSWHHSEGRGERKSLEQGGYARLWIEPADRAAHELILTILSTSRRPWELPLSLRFTPLGLCEMKRSTDPWPTVAESWREGVRALIEALRSIDDDAAKRQPVTEQEDYSDLVNLTHAALVRSGVVADTFRSTELQKRADRLSIPNAYAKDPERHRDCLAAHRECIAAWVAQLEQALNEWR